MKKPISKVCNQNYKSCLPNIEKRICTKCGTEKTINDFPFLKSSDGYYYTSGRCNECGKKYAHDHYKNNIERYKELHKAYVKIHKEEMEKWKKKYYEENKKEIREHAREYYENHKEQRRESDKKYREINKVHLYEKTREWAEKNRDRINASIRERRKRNPQKYRAIVKNYRERHKEQLKEHDLKRQIVISKDDPRWEKEKICKKCQEVKKGIDYYVNHRGTFDTFCKKCRNRTTKERNKQEYGQRAYEKVKKQRNSLNGPSAEVYIGQILKIPVEELRKYPELIEAKRLQMKIVRKLQNL